MLIYALVGLDYLLEVVDCLLVLTGCGIVFGLLCGCALWVLMSRFVSLLGRLLGFVCCGCVNCVLGVLRVV